MPSSWMRSVCPSASSPSTRVQTTPSAKSYASAGCTFIRPMVVGRTPDPGTTSASTSTSGSSRNPCRITRRTDLMTSSPPAPPRDRRSRCGSRSPARRRRTGRARSGRCGSPARVVPSSNVTSKSRSTNAEAPTTSPPGLKNARLAFSRVARTAATSRVPARVSVVRSRPPSSARPVEKSDRARTKSLARVVAEEPLDDVARQHVPDLGLQPGPGLLVDPPRLDRHDLEGDVGGLVRARRARLVARAGGEAHQQHCHQRPGEDTTGHAPHDGRSAEARAQLASTEFTSGSG